MHTSAYRQIKFWNNIDLQLRHIRDKRVASRQRHPKISKPYFAAYSVYKFVKVFVCAYAFALASNPY